MNVEAKLIFIIQYARNFPNVHIFEMCTDYEDARKRIVQLENDNYPPEYVGAYFTSAVRFPESRLTLSEEIKIAGKIFHVRPNDIEFCRKWFFPKNSKVEIYKDPL